MPAQPHDHQDHHHDNLGRKKRETLKRRTFPTNAALISKAIPFWIFRIFVCFVYTASMTLFKASRRLP
jgi:hypothetical protein